MTMLKHIHYQLDEVKTKIKSKPKKEFNKRLTVVKEDWETIEDARQRVMNQFSLTEEDLIKDRIQIRIITEG